MRRRQLDSEASATLSRGSLDFARPGVSGVGSVFVRPTFELGMPLRRSGVRAGAARLVFTVTRPRAGA